MKKVIFVGGTAYSGSTFFHMMLANDPEGYATGEVRSLLAPRKPNHRNLSCACGQEPCPDWQLVRERGSKHWVDVIFDNHPEVEIIVASSKSPIWIEEQNRILKAKGIDVRNVLIWKSPAEFGQSMKRRGYFYDWEKSFVNYHRLYAALIEDWRAVRYEDLVKNDEAVLEKVCNYVDIPYFEGKVNYWERPYHVLAGNTSAKFHLYEDKKAKAVVNNYDKERMNFYRKIYYRAPDDAEVLADVKRALVDNQNLQPVVQALEEWDVRNAKTERSSHTEIAMPFMGVALRKMKDFYLTQVGQIRYSS